MKKNYLKKLALILALPLIANSCSSDDDCSQNALLADLITNGIEILNGEIFESEEVTIANEILNSGLKNTCGNPSQTAAESEYSLDFDYRPIGETTWIESAATAYISIDELVANASTVENFTFMFQQAGEYRISGISDANNDVNERNEENNRNTIQQTGNQQLKVLVKASINKQNKTNQKIINASKGKNPNLKRLESTTVEQIQDFYLK